MVLSEDLARIATAARPFAEDDEELAAVIPAEPAGRMRVYLCAFGTEGEQKRWLAFDEDGYPLRERRLLREAVSIAAMCELAEEVAGGGNLEELRRQLVALRMTEDPPGIDEAEQAALALEQLLGRTPRVASPAYLDEVGGATRRLEQALGDAAASPFANAMRGAVDTIDGLTRDVEGNYKLDLV